MINGELIKWPEIVTASGETWMQRMEKASKNEEDGVVAPRNS